MFSLAFAKATAERVIATFAEALAAFLVANAVGVLDADWQTGASVAALAAVVALLKALAASQIGLEGPSLANEVVAPPAPKLPA